MHESFDDPVLGRVFWDQQGDCWSFDAGPINGRSIRATYGPADSRLPPQQQGWEGVRACVAWVRTNEGSVRGLLTDRMYDGWVKDWYEEDDEDLISPEEFKERFRLSGINFYDDQNARLIYEDGGLFGCHRFCVTINAAGEILSSDMFG